MVKNRVVSALAIILLVVSLAGCGGGGGLTLEKDIIGTWSPEENSSITFEIGDNGTAYLSEDGGEHKLPCTYVLKGTTLEFTVVSLAGEETFVWEKISIDGNKLTAYDPESSSTGTLVRVK